MLITLSAEDFSSRYSDHCVRIVPTINGKRTPWSIKQSRTPHVNTPRSPPPLRIRAVFSVSIMLTKNKNLKHLPCSYHMTYITKNHKHVENRVDVWHFLEAI